MNDNSSQFPVLSSQRDQNRTFFRWVKFNAVGGIGIGVQLAALAVFRSLLHFNYLLATALAVETAVIHNFLWHERFTWADRPAARPVQSLARLAKFNLSNGGVSIVGNLLLMRLLVGELHLNYVLADRHRDCGVLAGELPALRPPRFPAGKPMPVTYRDRVDLHLRPPSCPAPRGSSAAPSAKASGQARRLSGGHPRSPHRGRDALGTAGKMPALPLGDPRCNSRSRYSLSTLVSVSQSHRS